MLESVLLSTERKMLRLGPDGRGMLAMLFLGLGPGIDTYTAWRAYSAANAPAAPLAALVPGQNRARGRHSALRPREAEHPPSLGQAQP